MLRAGYRRGFRLQRRGGYHRTNPFCQAKRRSRRRNRSVISPEAAKGGPIGIVRNGDVIEIDAVKNTIDLRIPDEEYQRRLAAYVPPAPREKRGVLAKYAKLVSTASEGAVTDKYL